MRSRGANMIPKHVRHKDTQSRLCLYMSCSIQGVNFWKESRKMLENWHTETLTSSFCKNLPKTSFSAFAHAACFNWATVGMLTEKHDVTVSHRIVWPWSCAVKYSMMHSAKMAASDESVLISTTCEKPSWDQPGSEKFRDDDGWLRLDLIRVCSRACRRPAIATMLAHGKRIWAGGWSVVLRRRAG